jgi:hypothetical protein
VFRRCPGLYARSRRAYEAVNQRPAEPATVPETTRRTVSALYEPWNDLLLQQLRDAGITDVPSWLAHPTQK